MKEISLVTNLTTNLEDAMIDILKANAMAIRDVDGGEKPFLYASGWRGPGYIMVKGLISWPDLFPRLVNLLAAKVAVNVGAINFVAGNVTGGVIPGWLLSNYLEVLTGKKVSFIWVKGTRVVMGDDYPIHVTNKSLLERVAMQLSLHIFGAGYAYDFVAGAAPGGMVLGYRIAEILSRLNNRPVPFVYVRETRKKGGHKELITGIADNPLIKKGQTGVVVGQVKDFSESSYEIAEALKNEDFHAYNLTINISKEILELIPDIEYLIEDYNDMPGGKGTKGIVIEELMNFTASTTTTINILRGYEFIADDAATILFYGNPVGIKTAEENKFKVTDLFTLHQLLDVAEKHGTHNATLITKYRGFLADPVGWNKARGYEKIEKGGTQ